MNKTLFVGFDAACWDYFNPLLQAGKLPTILNLMNNGSFGTLESTLPAQTPTAWSSIITGKNPGKHGIFDFLLKNPTGVEFIPADANMRLGTPFWKRLNDAGIRVGLVNVPFNYPLTAINGFAVSGFGTPESQDEVIYPETASDVVIKRYPNFTPVVESEVLRHGSPEKIFNVERDHQQTFIEIALDLAKHFSVDILAINLLFPDHANHKMPDMADVEKAICETDAHLNQLINGFKPDNVMLFSDHGSRRVKGDFLLHAWLRDRGYCVQLQRSSSERSYSANWVIRQWLVNRNISGIKEKVSRRLLLPILRILPDDPGSAYWRLINARVPYAFEQINFKEELDPALSPILLGSSYSGLLYINDKSHAMDQTGVENFRVEILNSLKNQLKEIVDPDTGEVLFPDIYESKSIYSGLAEMFSPDLVIDFYESPWNVLGTFRRGYVGEAVRDRYFSSNFRDFGHHSRDGIYIFSGKDFQPGLKGPNANVVDLPATLLHLYDLSVPEDFDGKVMEYVFNIDYINRHPVQYQPGDVIETQTILDNFSNEKPYTLDEHLKALGYLD